MTTNPQNPDPARTPLPEEDIGEKEESIPGQETGDTTEQPPEPRPGESTGGIDTQLSPTKD